MWGKITRKCAMLRKQFFFEKKNQKTFARLSRSSRQRKLEWEKFFGSFFQKRTAFSAEPSPCSPPVPV
jgi:hypothetical protein